MMKTDKEAPLFVFHLSSKWRRFHIVFAVVFLFFFIFYFYGWIAYPNQASRSTSLGAWFFAYFAFLCLFCLFQTVYQAWFTRLVVTSNGLEYHTFGGSMYVAWANIERIGSYRRLLFKAEGLYLKSKDGVRGWLKIPLVIGRAFIPLTIFVPTWRDSQLGQIIYHHVPNLFKEQKESHRYSLFW